MMKQNASPLKQTQKSTKNTPKVPWVYAEELHRIVELDAYFLAEADGFRRPPLDYWLAAENDRRILPSPKVSS